MGHEEHHALWPELLLALQGPARHARGAVGGRGRCVTGSMLSPVATRPGSPAGCRRGTIVKKKDGTPRYVFEKTIHDFRRTAVRNLSRAGVRRDVAKAITGHVTDSMFSRYNITDEADLREGLEKASAYVAALPTQGDAK